MNRFRPIGLWADIVCVLTVAFFCSATPALAKQCSAERPSDARTYWSYRLIDGRKCWYEGKPKPEIVDRSPAPTPKGTLTADDLRAWGNSKTAMIAQPVLTIMDRWPDQELPQQRNTPVPAAQASSTSGRAIIMTVIIFMALSAVLLTTFRKINGAWRLPS